MSKESARKAFNGADKLEVFDYHGRHPDSGRGKHLARVRIEEMEATQDVPQGASTYRSFSPGGKFKFERHRSESEIGKEYTLLAVETFASLGENYVTGLGRGWMSSRTFSRRSPPTSRPGHSVSHAAPLSRGRRRRSSSARRARRSTPTSSAA